jgi:hypothetical protein
LYGVQSTVVWTHWPDPLQDELTSVEFPWQMVAAQEVPAGYRAH